MREKGMVFTEAAASELEVITSAVNEILDLSLAAFLRDDLQAASMVEPLEQVIDQLKEEMRTRHILRMQQGACSIEVGFIWSDLLTSLERTSDHCSNIAGCVIDMANHNMNLHESLRSVRNDSQVFQENFSAYVGKYHLKNKLFLSKRNRKPAGLTQEEFAMRSGPAVICRHFLTIKENEQ